MTAPVLKCEVDRTLYEAGTTQRGSACFIVSYYTGYEVHKQWLFPGPKLEDWWNARSSARCPSSCVAIADLATRGAVLPTKYIHYKREGRWTNVVRTEVGQFPPAFAEFMKEARDVFGDIEVIKVIA